MDNLINVSLYWSKSEIEHLSGITSIPEERWEELKEYLIEHLETFLYDYGKEVVQMIIEKEVDLHQE